MKAPAVIASVTIACSLGFAAGQGRPVMPQQDMATHPVPPKHSMTQDAAGSEGGMAMQVGGEGQCVIGEPLNWFTNVHLLPSCFDGSFSHMALSDGGSVDVDGDTRYDHIALVYEIGSPDLDPICGASGSIEFGGLTYCMSNSGCFVAGKPSKFVGRPFPFPNELGLYRYSLSNSAGVPKITYHSVLSGAVLTAAFCAVAPCDSPNQNYYVFEPKQLHDWDGDVDLDLIALLRWRLAEENWQVYHSAWVVVENTVETVPPLATDINRDGVVDGQDLAFVLSAWTP